MSKIFSMNCLTNGVWGQTFCVGAIVYEDGEEISRIMLRAPLPHDIDSQTQSTLDSLSRIEVDCEGYVELLSKFSTFYLKHKEAVVATYAGHIAEIKLFRDACSYGFITIEDMPKCFHDVKQGMYQIGYVNPTLQDFVDNHFLEVEKQTQGGVNGPLYACKAIAYTYIKLSYMR